LINEAEEENWHAALLATTTLAELITATSTLARSRIRFGRVYVFFDLTDKITAIDISYDKSQWDEVLQLLNTKYGDNC